MAGAGSEHEYRMNGCLINISTRSISTTHHFGDYYYSDAQNAVLGYVVTVHAASSANRAIELYTTEVS